MVSKQWSFDPVPHQRNNASIVRTLIRIKKNLFIRCVVYFAYAIYAVERFLALPQYVFLACCIAILAFVSFIRWEPFLWEKIGLEISPQTSTDYVRVIRMAHVLGDPLFAESMYVRILPYLSTQQDKRTFREETYPQERLELLRAFWSSVLQLQPTSREAFAALTLIHHSLQEKEAEFSTLEIWKNIEPNDQRLPALEKK